MSSEQPHFVCSQRWDLSAQQRGADPRHILRWRAALPLRRGAPSRHLRNVRALERVALFDLLARHVLEQPELLEDGEGVRRLVERVEVQALNQPRLEQLCAQVCDILQPHRLEALRVVLELVALRLEIGGHAALAEARHPREAARRGDEHDAGQDGHLDAARTHRMHKRLEDLIVEEHLCDDGVAARVDLRLEVVELALEVRVGAHELLPVDRHQPLLLGRAQRPAQVFDRLDHVGVAFGVAGDLDAEPVAEAGADVLDEVERALEAALDRLPLLLPLGRVAAQRDDVTDAVPLRFAQRLAAQRRGLVGAREVHVDVEAEALVRLAAQVHRKLARAAARAPREVEEERLLLAMTSSVLYSVSTPAAVFGGKYSNEMYGLPGFAAAHDLILSEIFSHACSTGSVSSDGLKKAAASARAAAASAAGSTTEDDDA
eukprot:CAMPEP_0119424108 /NCGR_PEP_ID=MMETSP1335-20130426/31803_1 /TAXON_ID=259385 /ORGANISM="Chrysoculter rhomboideus, Strain RCC1486" /LENGTH=431 /DNA_ID=CAMNT_0007449621 /DNA_START=135 /DNA_END=1428 /DNA_ORIENTATION=+